jgi:hypothetical protein
VRARIAFNKTANFYGYTYTGNVGDEYEALAMGKKKPFPVAICTTQLPH